MVFELGLHCLPMILLQFLDKNGLNRDLRVVKFKIMLRCAKEFGSGTHFQNRYQKIKMSRFLRTCKVWNDSKWNMNALLKDNWYGFLVKYLYVKRQKLSSSICSKAPGVPYANKSWTRKIKQCILRRRRLCRKINPLNRFVETKNKCCGWCVWQWYNAFQVFVTGIAFDHLT